MYLNILYAFMAWTGENLPFLIRTDAARDERKKNPPAAILRYLQQNAA
jgi:hypothetical protein